MKNYMDEKSSRNIFVKINPSANTINLNTLIYHKKKKKKNSAELGNRIIKYRHFELTT